MLGEIFMPQMMVVLAPGFSDDPAKFALAVTLTRITFPYLLLICLDRAAVRRAERARPLHRGGRGAARVQRDLDRLHALADALCRDARRMPSPGASAWPGVAMLGMLLWAVRRAGMGVPLLVPRALARRCAC